MRHLKKHLVECDCLYKIEDKHIVEIFYSGILSDSGHMLNTLGMYDSTIRNFSEIAKRIDFALENDYWYMKLLNNKKRNIT